jgi:acetylornithine/N-succinyldiaminopimelate aminotransferase
MAASVALAALEILNSDEIRHNIVERNAQLIEVLNQLNDELHCFTEIRGRGLMIGAELKPEWHGKAGDISERARAKGVLVLVAGPNVCRFLPPLNITQVELATGLERFASALRDYIAA